MNKAKNKDIVYYNEMHTAMYQLVTVKINEKVLQEAIEEELNPDNIKQLIQASYLLGLEQGINIKEKTSYGAWNAHIEKLEHLYHYDKFINNKLKNNVNAEDLNAEVSYVDRLLGLSKEERKDSIKVKEIFYKTLDLEYRAPREIVYVQKVERGFKNVSIVRIDEKVLKDMLEEDLTKESKRELLQALYVSQLVKKVLIKEKDVYGNWKVQIEPIEHISQYKDDIINKLKSHLNENIINKEIDFMNNEILHLDNKEKFDTINIKYDIVQQLGMKRPKFKI